MLKDIIPPALFRLLRPLPRYGYFGTYSRWEEAEALTSGYDEAGILQRVQAAALQVKAGKAAFERDSMVFQQEEINPFILSMLMWVAAQAQGTLHVTDFGGSLGSTYFQHRKYLDQLPLHSWSIIEQAHFSQFGREQMSTPALSFFNSVRESRAAHPQQVLLFSSVLQYLRNPIAILNELDLGQFPYLLLDRTAFHSGTEDILTVQKVNPQIYQASYPAWFFSEQKLMSELEITHRLFSSVRNEEYSNRPELYFKGLFFIRKDLF